jgi:hypothetical protein
MAMVRGGAGVEPLNSLPAEGARILWAADVLRQGGDQTQGKGTGNDGALSNRRDTKVLLPCLGDNALHHRHAAAECPRDLVHAHAFGSQPLDRSATLL